MQMNMIDNPQIYKIKLKDNPKLKQKVLKNLYFYLSITMFISLITTIFIIFSDLLVKIGKLPEILIIIIGIGLFLTDLIMVLFIQKSSISISVPILIILFLLISIFNGAILTLFLKESAQLSLLILFFASACMYLLTGLIGLIPNVDLSAFKYNGIMTSVIGIIITVLLNLIFKTVWAEWVLTIFFVIVFAGIAMINIDKYEKKVITIDVSKKLSALQLALPIVCELYITILIAIIEALIEGGDDSSE